ncbi:MAG: type VI secretion system membrane subunit TssM [Nitrococcus sp.]|nr:type VI secretion system membrane subunit TssM [Nitrococcus sp.]
MKRPLTMLGSGWFLGLLGVLLLSLLIWLFAPYVAFAGVRPLAGGLARAIAIGVIVVIWAVAVLLSYQRIRRNNERSDAELSGAAQSAGDELRRRFESAIGFLRGSNKGGNLYQLPWYVIIGPPRSGKTTALVNSGLSFALCQQFGKEALCAAGRTRNCDWWFTDDAVLLDTAGRYLSQDTDASADHAEWGRFLELLMYYRKRRPFDGVIVTLSASDLLNQSAHAHDRHVMTVRWRVDELQQHLRIQFPVYFMLTKCDLVAGFAEFFDDLGHEARAQVWGITFPEPGKSGPRPSEVFRREYPALIGRLNERVLFRLDQERELQRRALLFGFPGRMASLQDGLADFIEAAFEGSRFERPVVLRGVYFTSGIQGGIPIDRMMQTFTRNFGIDTETVSSVAGGQGRGYFLQRLFKEVIFWESGLVGESRRSRVDRAVVQKIAYVALIGLVLLLVAGWLASTGTIGIT